MSHNVGVFVDVSNLFYSAKSASVEVNYCRLMEHAVAGRDLIRASAYTGVDPENPNQRKFIDFLRANGYKVICKDIHKYEGGRIKANLDIEIAVDIMLLSENLDVVVLVSGDGDFVRLVEAVQSKGVRCEVIGFGISTSNELIDAADLFTEIASLPGIFRNAPSGPQFQIRGMQTQSAADNRGNFYSSVSAYSFNPPPPGERLTGERERVRMFGERSSQPASAGALGSGEQSSHSPGYSFATHDEFMLPDAEACADYHSIPLARPSRSIENGS